MPGRPGRRVPRPACAWRNSAASRSTAASSRGASPGAGLVAIHCSISRATTLISGKPYDPPEPASRWNRRLERRRRLGPQGAERGDVRRGAPPAARETPRGTRAAARASRRRAGRLMAACRKLLEGQPGAGHEGRCRAPVAADVGALARGQDRAPIVHHADDRHARPRGSPDTTSTTANPRSTGAVAHSSERHARRVGPPQRGRQQRKGVGRRQQRHRDRGARHVVGDELKHRPPGLDLDQGRRGRDAHRVQFAAQPLERQTMVGRDPRDQRGGASRAGSAWAARLHPGRALRDQPLERAVGVGARQAGGPSDGVAGAGAAGEEDLVHQAFGGREAEVRQVDPGHDE